MRHLLTTLTALTVLLSCNSLTTKKDIPMPTDFNFRYVFDDTEVISTFNSTYRRIYMFHDTIISLSLSNEEKKRIYTAMVENKVFEMPDVFEIDKSFLCIQPTSNILYINANNLKKKIKYECQCATKDTVTANRYLIIIKTINDILITKKEIQQLPPSDIRTL